MRSVLVGLGDEIATPGETRALERLKGRAATRF